MQSPPSSSEVCGGWALGTLKLVKYDRQEGAPVKRPVSASAFTGKVRARASQQFGQQLASACLAFPFPCLSSFHCFASTVLPLSFCVDCLAYSNVYKFLIIWNDRLLLPKCTVILGSQWNLNCATAWARHILKLMVPSLAAAPAIVSHLERSLAPSISLFTRRLEKQLWNIYQPSLLTLGAWVCCAVWLTGQSIFLLHLQLLDTAICYHKLL